MRSLATSTSLPHVLLPLSLLLLLSFSTLKMLKTVKAMPAPATAYAAQPGHEYRVALATKKKTTQTYDPPVYSNTSDFKELVKNSQIFIDNSLLMEGIVEESTFQSKYLRISVPPKWGKTVNMRMLKAFFEIQVYENGTVIEPKETTSNYKLFRAGEIVSDNGAVERLTKPLLILGKKRFCNEHQGQYPVMYLPFKNITGNSVDELAQSVNDFIRRLYREFQYVTVPMMEHKSKIKLDSYVKFKLDRYNQTLNGNITDRTFALEFLSQVLYEHFVKKVVVIIDDYSSPSMDARKNRQLDEDEIYQVDQLVNDLTYKLTHNFNYNRMIIITGWEDVQLPTFENFWDNNITGRDLPWFKHFGFNQNDVNVLFEKKTIPEQLLKLPDQSYETGAKDVSLATMAQYLNRDEIKKVLLT